MAMIDAAAGSANCWHEREARPVEGSRRPARHRQKPRAHRQGNGGLHQNLEARLNASKQEITQLQETLEAVRNESLTDPLTQLANHRFFDTSLAAAIADARTKNEPLSLMMTDIDHFKHFNYSFGHLIGDQVLRLVATLTEAERQGPGHRRPLWQRGVRHYLAQHRAALGNRGRRPHLPRGDDQATHEALDRRASRPRHGLDRRRHVEKTTPRRASSSAPTCASMPPSGTGVIA